MLTNTRNLYTRGMNCSNIGNQIFRLLILKINFIGMIRQKRFPVNRAPNPSKNNNDLMDTNIINNYLSNEGKDNRINQNRLALNEISTNSNISSNRQSFFMKLLTSDNKYKPQSKVKEKENILCKISELIKNEDVQLPICHSNKSKPLSCLQQRPNTSLGRYSKTNLDCSHANKYSVVLHLTKIQQEKPPQRISTSRALMNYSKVYRNHIGSNQGFRVRKDVSLMNKFVHLSAQKMVFHEKQKKDKKDGLDRTFDRPILSKRASIDDKPKRYESQEQQFQLGGWDYFE